MIKEDLAKVNELHKEISRVNDLVIKQTDHLRIALINLKIEDARLSENTGIVPIANQVEKVINELHDNVTKLVNENRTELRKAFGNIENHIKSEFQNSSNADL